MTFGKASALTLGLLAAMAFGIWIGPYVMDSSPMVADKAAVKTAAPPAAVAEESAVASRAGRTAEKRASAPEGEAMASAISTSAPELHARIKPLLNKGADMTLASAGFQDAEQFAAVAHAARNTEIPFVLLRHRVLNEGKTLSAAIQESRQDLNAEVEANLAFAQAKSDLAAVGG
jgi:hypothetical protein